MVLDCGLENCCMPGYHLRSECHTPEMIEAMEDEHSPVGEKRSSISCVTSTCSAQTIGKRLWACSTPRPKHTT